MRVFIKKICLIAVLFIIAMLAYACLMFKYVCPQYEGLYAASAIDKIERECSINEPKIILVGNSNLAFGIQSDIIEESLEMPVVNMGLHAGVGEKFHISIAKANIREGDIVVYCPTDMGSDYKIKGIDLVWTIMENHYDIWKLMELADWYELLPGVPEYLFNAFFLKVYRAEHHDYNWSCDEYYSRDAFNEYGDNISIREKRKFEIEEGLVTIPNISSECIDAINEFGRYCENRGAILLISAYPIIDYYDTPDKDEFEALKDELVKSVNYEVISDYNDYRFSVDYFFDQPLHLTNEGALLRTRQLVGDLLDWRLSKALNGKR